MGDSERTQTSPGPEHMLRLLRIAIESWPQFDTDASVNGGDLVEWFGEWRQQVKEALDLD